MPVVGDAAMLTDRQRKWLGRIGIGIAAFLLYAVVVWTYFQFERFSSRRPDITFWQAVWYVVLNPTGLGSTTTKLFPSTLPGRLIGVLFALTSIGLLGVFIGKVSDMFNEVREQAWLGRRRSRLSNHVVILGWDDYSRRVARELARSEIEVVIVTADKPDIDPIREAFDDEEGERVYPVYADYDNYAALDRFGDISRSSRVFLNRRDDTDTLITLFNLHDAFAGEELSYVVRVRNERLLDRFDLEHKNIDVTPVWTFGVATALVASYIYEPEVADLARDFITTSEGEDDHRIEQYLVADDAPFAGKSYNRVFEWFFERGVYLIGIGRGGEDTDDGTPEVELLADGERGESLAVEAGDYVIVALEAALEEQMESWTGHSTGLRSLNADA